MYYEINVAKLHEGTGRYQHYFATAERSISSMRELRDLYKDISQRFPASQGFEVTCSEWSRTGKELDASSVMNYQTTYEQRQQRPKVKTS